MIIPDLSILLYAVDGDSSRHGEAITWLEDTVNAGVEEIGRLLVVCRGILRLSTNPRVFPAPLSAEEALVWLSALREARAVREVNPGKAHLDLLEERYPTR